jgi:PAT family beta-lactamase induction signal transducer AmpG
MHMDTALDQVADGFVPRGLAPPWYSAIYLPMGLSSGFVTVSLAYLLAHHGVGVPAIAAMVALSGLPTTWRFIAGPVIDASFTPQAWYLGLNLLCAAALAAFAIIPLTPAAMPAIMAPALAGAVCANAAAAAATAAMAMTTPQSQRGAVAGWQQCGSLGGVGLGGGLSLWLAEHAGGQSTAALGMAALCLTCVWPILRLRVPPRLANTQVAARLGATLRALWILAKSRSGVLAILVVTLPAGLGSAILLLSTVAGDWGASADMVALMLGALSGIANLPGCLVGGYMSDLFPRRTVYVCVALACALGEAAMAWAPHTPVMFCVFVILNAVLLGASYAAVSAIVYGELTQAGAATIGGVLGSLSNVPVVAVIALLGLVQPKHGSSGMLLTEATLGVVSMVAYVLLAWLWKPAGAGGLQPAAAPA